MFCLQSPLGDSDTSRVAQVSQPPQPCSGGNGRYRKTSGGRHPTHTQTHQFSVGPADLGTDGQFTSLVTNLHLCQQSIGKIFLILYIF